MFLKTNEYFIGIRIFMPSQNAYLFPKLFFNCSRSSLMSEILVLKSCCTSAAFSSDATTGATSAGLTKAKYMTATNSIMTIATSRYTNFTSALFFFLATQHHINYFVDYKQDIIHSINNLIQIPSCCCIPY